MHILHLLSLITLFCFVLAEPSIRLLLDPPQPTDPSLSQVCVQATALGCNYQTFKPTSVCYKEDQSLNIKNRRHLKYCQNCLLKKKSNQVASFKVKEISTDDCLTDAQVARKIGLTLSPPVSQNNPSLKTTWSRKLRGTLPTSFDYLNYMSSVKNQGSCGCCWAFAGTAVYQALLKINGFNYDISAQAALECTLDYNYITPKFNSSCNGGYLEDVLNFYGKVGGLPASKYPYMAANYSVPSDFPNTPGICNDTNRIMLGDGKIDFYHNITQDQIKNLIYTQGPLAVAVQANNLFQSYTSGFFNGCPAGSASRLNHAVLLYGWDANDNWLIKNQWGSSWGQAGYMILSNTSDCGLSSYLGSMTFTNRNTNVQVVIDPECKKTSATLPCVNYNITDNTNTTNPFLSFDHYLKFAFIMLMMTFLL